jgi:putative N6-adenine-specific DNA methylase
LHQRGYGTATNIAPINEVLAAGVLLLSGWDGQGDFLDNNVVRYFLAEAAMIAVIFRQILIVKVCIRKIAQWDNDLFDISLIVY